MDYPNYQLYLERTSEALAQALRIRPWNCASNASSCGDNLICEGTCIPVAVIEICSASFEPAAVEAWLACGCNVFWLWSLSVECLYSQV
jgi:hypothetical protein